MLAQSFRFVNIEISLNSGNYNISDEDARTLSVFEDEDKVKAVKGKGALSLASLRLTKAEPCPLRITVQTAFRQQITDQFRVIHKDEIGL